MTTGLVGVDAASGAVLPDVYANPATNAARVPKAVAVADARDEALDGVKGALVLFMVLYHWANYYVGVEWAGYRYLRS